MPGNRTKESLIPAALQPTIAAASSGEEPVPADVEKALQPTDVDDTEKTRSTVDDMAQPEAGKATPVKGKDYLLLIAIDYYKNSNYNLANPVRDANALLEILTKRYGFAPGDYREFDSDEKRDAHEQGTYDLLKELPGQEDRYENDNYRVYKNGRIICLYNEAVTRGTIKRNIDVIKSKMQADDRLLIYYSGHGYEDPKDSLNLTAYDFDKTDFDTYLLVDDLLRPFSKYDNKCQNLLLIIDACYSGAAIFGNKHDSSLKISREILTSCNHEQKAPDGRKFMGSPFPETL